MTSNIVFKDNSAQVKALYEQKAREALERIGLVWLNNVVGGVPVDTGRLRASMKYEVDFANRRVIVGSDVFYAIFVELGTVKMRAQPYLGPSIMNHVADYESAVRATLGSGWGVSVSDMSTTSSYYSGDNRVANV